MTAQIIPWPLWRRLDQIQGDLEPYYNRVKEGGRERLAKQLNPGKEWSYDKSTDQFDYDPDVAETLKLLKAYNPFDIYYGAKNNDKR